MWYLGATKYYINGKIVKIPYRDWYRQKKYVYVAEYLRGSIDIENDLTPFYFKTTWVDNKFDYKQKLLGLVFRTMEEVDAYSPIFKARLREVGWK